MEIYNYIIRGGENLNDPPVKTSGFPSTAVRKLNEWQAHLGKDDAEPENYVEIPLDHENRLFLRAFWFEARGNRPVCYYVGFLLPKELYRSAKEYFLINKGLRAISLDTVQAYSQQLAPIPLKTERACPKTSVWTPYAQLKKKLYGTEEFEQNMIEMCSSISINNMDDWFEKLTVAVNPYRFHPSYDFIVSRREPRTYVSRENMQVKRHHEEPESKSRNYKKTIRNILFPTIIFLGVIIVAQKKVADLLINTDPNPPPETSVIDSWPPEPDGSTPNSPQEEDEKSEDEKKKIKNTVKNLEDKIEKLENTVKNLEDKIEKLKNGNKKSEDEKKKETEHSDSL